MGEKLRKKVKGVAGDGGSLPICRRLSDGSGTHVLAFLPDLMH